MSDDSKPTTLAGAFRRGVLGALAGVRTWQPGRVESYNEATRRATVQPLIGRRVRGEDDELVVEHDPPIPDVPIGFPGGGGARFRFPVSRGDIVLLLFCERSLDKFKGGLTGKPHDPEDDRRHNASDAIAIPCVIGDEGDGDVLVEITAAGQVYVGGELPLALTSELAALKSAIASTLAGATATDLLASIKAIFAAWSIPGTVVTKGQ